MRVPAGLRSHPVVAVAFDVWRQVFRHRLLGEAAKIAYFFFLSLFPLILVLFALTGTLGGEAAFDRIMRELGELLPRSSAGELARFVRDITDSRRPAALSLSIGLTVWTASTGLLALGDSLRMVFGVRRGPPWWRRRALALAVLAGESLTLVALALLLAAGPEILRAAGVGPLAAALRGPLTFAIVLLLVWRLYATLPGHVRRPAQRDLAIGALVATTLWTLATWGFRIYVRTIPRYAIMYGVVGGIIALLVWLQLAALTLLLGAVVAARLEPRRQRERRRRRAPVRSLAGRESARVLERGEGAAHPGDVGAAHVGHGIGDGQRHLDVR